MDPNSRRREDYRGQRQSSSKLNRNRALATSAVAVKGNTAARVICLLATLIVSFGVAYFAHLYFTLHTIGGDAGNGATSAQIAHHQPISVLILGVDQGIEGRHDKGNSDTLILATANPSKNKVTMTSIPRDTLADIKGDPSDKYSMFRVNSAYGVGGSSSAVKTVSALVNVPINYYVEVNMKALKSLVNAVGGVDVNVPFDFSYDWNDFHKGKQHLNGRHAVAYVRMRKEDPRGDYGRQQRQRQVIMAVAHKAISVNSISNYRKLVKIFNKYVKTNLTFNDMLALALNYRNCMDHLVSGFIQGHDAWVGGASLQIASTSELQKHSDKMRANLGLDKVILKNEETRQNSLNEQNNGIKWKDPAPFNNYQIYPASSSSQDSGSNSSSNDDNSDNSWNIFGQ